MGVTPAHWLVDKSVISRLHEQAVLNVVQPAVAAGLVAVSIVTELEVGYSARSTADYRRSRRDIIDRLLPIALPARAEQRVREVQAALVEKGQHRSAGVADLLIAATAEVEGLTVWHYDADFEVIAAVTGQPVEWVVPRGTAG